MGSYVPYYGKKREHLALLQRELVSLLKTTAGHNEITDAADAVRIAKIRALKAKRERLAPRETNLPEVEAIDREIESWSVMPIDAIVTKYRSKRG